MLWFFFALTTAICESFRDVFNKKSLKTNDVYIVAWSLNFFTVVFLLPLVFVTGIPEIGDRFFLALAVNSILNGLAFLALMKAIQASDLSKVAPMTTFTPLFLLLTSPLIVGEFPNPSGFIGIALIVTGAYLLNLNARKSGYLAPFKMLWKERGTKLGLLVAFLWSITANFDKIGVQNSAPIFWVASMFAGITLLLSPLVIINSGLKLSKWGSIGKSLVLIGLFNAIAVAFQMFALNLTLVAYVISVKRTSAIFSVVWSKLIFKESGFQERVFGASVMVSGVICIALSG
ncbi:EamA family transporter [Oscillatoriales cyanobacterium LEGE 11467]|uniref:EamA family transporter n=1 Tax=Zarconia navalis LEGE 11467 TaxID=1828826 RepID=A0A928VTN0_9CYAN|nr:DMT family transporter [Zarconia navalis]MBE9040144.1 EamA family transporter [Zarconia navalis LEGE 11467]